MSSAEVGGPTVGQPPANRGPRALFAAGLFMALLSYNRVARMDSVAYPRGLARWIDLSWAVQPAAQGVLVVMFLVALVAWVLRAREGAAAAVMIAVLWIAESLALSEWADDVGGNKAAVLPVASLFGYSVTRAWATRRGMAPITVERLAVEAACGVCAAAYCLAGVSKVWESGLMWASGSNLALHITVHGWRGVEALIPFRLAVAQLLPLCTVFGVGTLIVECGYLFFVVPALRKPLSIAATLMHLSIGLVMGLHHYDWMFVEIGLAWYVVGDQRGRMVGGTGAS